MKRRLLAFILALAAVCMPLMGCSLFSGTPADAAALLPDWEGIETNDWHTYRSVTSEMIEAYFSQCRGRGFTVLRHEASGSATLIRDDAWIRVIRSVTETPSVFNAEMKVMLRSAGSKVVSNDRAAKLIALTLDDGEAVAAVLERTPEGMAEAAGIAYFDCAVTRDGGREHSLMSYFVGPNGAVCAEASLRMPLLEMLAADLDGDGKSEVVAQTWGPTSGLHSRAIEAVFVSDGVPYVKAFSVFTMPHGTFHIVNTASGGAALSLAKNVWNAETKELEAAEALLYPIRLNGSLIEAECSPGDRDAPGLWGGAADAYLYYKNDPDVDLTKGLTLFARPSPERYSFSLLPTVIAEVMHPTKLNSFPPVGAEEMRALFEYYEQPAEAADVVIAGIPAADVRTATEAELAEILALLG